MVRGGSIGALQPMSSAIGRPSTSDYAAPMKELPKVAFSKTLQSAESGVLLIAGDRLAGLRAIKPPS